MGKTTYYANPAHNRAAIILSSMSPDMVADIVSLCNSRGGSLQADLYASNTAANMNSNRFLAIFSRDFIADEDFEDVFVGFSAIVLASLRAPRMGNDEYTNILSTAYALPSGMAAALASKIESRDILGGTDDKRDWLESFYEGVREYAKRGINQVIGLINPGWEIDETQEYDIDLLWEWKSLGTIIADLNSRVRLMSAQVAINSNTGLFAMDLAGDPELGDVYEEAAVGDVFRALSLRRLPPSVYGGQSAIARAGASASAKAARRIVDDAGLAASPTASPASSGVKNPKLRSIVDKLIGGKPSAAVAAGLALGLTPLAITTLVKAVRSRKKGDVEEGDAYSDLSASYGNNVANAWSMGDVESVISEVLDDAMEPATTGDPDLDDAIDAQVASEVGDIYGDTEIGGLVTRVRANMAKKAYARRRRRGYTQASKIKAKDARAQSLARSRYAKKTASIPDVYFDDTLPGDEGEDYAGNPDEFAGPEYFEAPPSFEEGFE